MGGWVGGCVGVAWGVRRDTLSSGVSGVGEKKVRSWVMGPWDRFTQDSFDLQFQANGTSEKEETNGGEVETSA